MKEIGGYLELDTSNGEIFHKNALALNSGRHCLEYLLLAKRISKLYIPDFMCHTTKHICEKHNCPYEYYPIQTNFLPDLQSEIKNDEYVYIVNYYGQLSNEIITQLADCYGNVIIDNVEAFFQMPVNDIDTIYSCRKFFGVPDGAYLYTTSKMSRELEIDLSYDRMGFVLGRYEKDAPTFFKDASENNSFFDNQPIKQMSKLTQNLLRTISYDTIRQKREENFKFLHKHLNEINEIDVVIPIGPFMYPLYINNGLQLRKKLIEKKIYIPCLWGDVFDIAQRTSIAWRYTENILPLPCDQRYGQDEMQYIIDQILT